MAIISKPIDILRIIFRRKPKRPLTSEEIQAINDQVIIIDPITRSK